MSSGVLSVSNVSRKVRAAKVARAAASTGWARRMLVKGSEAEDSSNAAISCTSQCLSKFARLPHANQRQTRSGHVLPGDAETSCVSTGEPRDRTLPHPHPPCGATACEGLGGGHAHCPLRRRA